MHDLHGYGPCTLLVWAVLLCASKILVAWENCLTAAGPETRLVVHVFRRGPVLVFRRGPAGRDCGHATAMCVCVCVCVCAGRIAD